ncbi:hypothetical protein D3C77_403950 [compost metagenome]
MQFPLRVLSLLNMVIQVARCVVKIPSLNFTCFICCEVGHTLLRLPCIFNISHSSLGIDPFEGMYTEAVHLAIVRWSSAIRKQPGHHVRGLRGQCHEIPIPGRILNVGGRRRLKRVNHIREFNCIANKKYRQMIPHNIIVAFLCIKLYRKASWVTRRLWRSLSVDDRREANEHRCFFAGLLQEMSPRMLRHAALRNEYSMGSCPAGMNDTLWNALPVKMGQLLEQMVVLQ